MTEQYAALIEMAFDTKEDAHEWLADAEELGGKRNGELLETNLEEL